MRKRFSFVILSIVFAILLIENNAEGKSLDCSNVLECVEANSDNDWWKTGIFYQIYPRSWMDSDGDGNGDLKGEKKQFFIFCYKSHCRKV